MPYKSPAVASPQAPKISFPDLRNLMAFRSRVQNYCDRTAHGGSCGIQELTVTRAVKNVNGVGKQIGDGVE
jgi:hypothetical protein